MAEEVLTVMAFVRFSFHGCLIAVDGSGATLLMSNPFICLALQDWLLVVWLLKGLVFLHLHCLQARFSSGLI